MQWWKEAIIGGSVGGLIVAGSVILVFLACLGGRRLVRRFRLHRSTSLPAPEAPDAEPQIEPRVDNQIAVMELATRLQSEQLAREQAAWTARQIADRTASIAPMPTPRYHSRQPDIRTRLQGYFGDLRLRFGDSAVDSIAIYDVPLSDPIDDVVDATLRLARAAVWLTVGDENSVTWDFERTTAELDAIIVNGAARHRDSREPLRSAVTYVRGDSSTILAELMQAGSSNPLPFSEPTPPEIVQPPRLPTGVRASRKVVLLKCDET